jgi:hypothetical protein
MNNSHFVVVAGDTLDQRIDVPDFPSSDGWTLKYRLVASFATPTQAEIDLLAVANADGSYQLQAGPSATGGWAPGAYSWGRWVEKVGARQTLSSSNEQGAVVVRQNPATAAQGSQGYDTRTHARKMLDLIETAQLALKGGTKSYTIGSRSYTARDLDELRGDREYWARAVAAELNEELLNSGAQPGHRLLARL